MFDDYPDILAPSQAMELLGIKKCLLYRLLREGTIPATHIGTRIWRIKKSDLIDYLDTTK